MGCGSSSVPKVEPQKSPSDGTEGQDGIERSFITSADGTKLHIGHIGTGEKNVLIVHGLAEHIGRWKHVIGAIVEAGWRCTIVEYRGHGKSEGKKGHVYQWSEYIDDIRAAAATIKGPTVIMGQSLGGLIALYSVFEGVGLDLIGVVLGNPNVRTAIQAPAVKKFGARVLSKVSPSLSMPNEINVNHLSRDPEVVAEYVADPQIYDTCTPRFYTEMIKAQDFVESYPVEDVKVPLLLMIGEHDQICDHHASSALAGRWGGTKDVIKFPDMYHLTFDGPEKAQVLENLKSFLQKLS